MSNPMKHWVLLQIVSSDNLVTLGDGFLEKSVLFFCFVQCGTAALSQIIKRK